MRQQSRYWLLPLGPTPEPRGHRLTYGEAHDLLDAPSTERLITTDWMTPARRSDGAVRIRYIYHMEALPTGEVNQHAQFISHTCFDIPVLLELGGTGDDWDSGDSGDSE